MVKRICMVLVFCLVSVSLSFAAAVEGVDVPDKFSVGDMELVLNGAGVRVKSIGFIKKNIYVASLYLKEKTSNPQKIIAADETMVLRIKIITSLVTSERFTNHTKSGFQEATKGNTTSIQKEIDTFLSVFADEINNGDLFEIVYKKGAGVQVFKNGSKEAKATIPGMPLKSALFAIWLGERSEKNLRALAKNLLSMPSS